jgi:hypothetical protein
MPKKHRRIRVTLTRAEGSEEGLASVMYLVLGIGGFAVVALCVVGIVSKYYWW